MKTSFFFAALAFISSGAFANCSDGICQVQVGGKIIDIDVEACGVAATPDVTFTGTDGKTVRLPSNSVGPATPGLIALNAGYWFDDNEQKVKFVDDGAAVVFDLEAKAQGNSTYVGKLTSTLPGLNVTDAKAVCK